jgi:hypothetical protein
MVDRFQKQDAFKFIAQNEAHSRITFEFAFPGMIKKRLE